MGGEGWGPWPHGGFARRHPWLRDQVHKEINSDDQIELDVHEVPKPKPLQKLLVAGKVKIFDRSKRKGQQTSSFFS
ncbi:hypothetical protein TIFTF001_013963 [Ficus carica]|uniref:Uncharacterized protein n=1 Tax=Ficus carica TaxID=3494 RepID=A0AA88AQM1_FICCA|nr:hypothetical protein TIFTF001_013963 [Ficus carica]